MEVVDTITWECDKSRTITVTSTSSGTHECDTVRVTLITNSGTYSCTCARECGLFKILNECFDRVVTYRLAKIVGPPDREHGYKLTFVLTRESKLSEHISQHTEICVVLLPMW